MKQESFSDMEYSCRKKKTKREEFLEIMDEIIPWDEWVGISGRTIQQESVAVHQLRLLKSCCGCICCNAGSTCQMSA